METSLAIKSCLYNILLNQGDTNNIYSELALLVSLLDLDVEDSNRNIEFTSTGMFVGAALNFLGQGNHDGFIDYLKETLLKLERYELLKELHL